MLFKDGQDMGEGSLESKNVLKVSRGAVSLYAGHYRSFKIWTSQSIPRLHLTKMFLKSLKIKYFEFFCLYF